MSRIQIQRIRTSQRAPYFLIAITISVAIISSVLIYSKSQKNEASCGPAFERIALSSSIQNRRRLPSDDTLGSQKDQIVLSLLQAKVAQQHPNFSRLIRKNAGPACLSDTQWDVGGVSVYVAKGTLLPVCFEPVQVSFRIRELCQAQPEPVVLNYIDPNKPMVALTFDDGPCSNTPRILELLRDNGCRATFFVVGSRIRSNAQIIADTIAQGSEVMGHSWSHKDLSTLSENSIRKEIHETNEAIYNIAGVEPIGFRPPYGSVNTNVLKVAREEGLSLINWSVDPRDWQTRNAEMVYNEIMRSIVDGSIILCHDLHSTTADAMERVIPELLRQGYQLVTVSELLGEALPVIEPGVVYRHK
ncbi:MAG: polysaccharide deacetylase family protein [Eubacteriaceae bacterium]|nr:polysaccharide deacetylase family protein [Eubacteriaceae bacterium]